MVLEGGALDPGPGKVLEHEGADDQRQGQGPAPPGEDPAPQDGGDAGPEEDRVAAVVDDRQRSVVIGVAVSRHKRASQRSHVCLSVAFEGLE